MNLTTNLTIVPWVVFFPLIGLFLNLVFGRWLGRKPAGWLASIFSTLSFLTALVLALALGTHPEGQDITLTHWISIGTLDVEWAFRVDTLSVTMMLVVAGVGSIIHFYSIGYMDSDTHHNGDPDRYRRFFIYLNFFIATMQLLVSANNFLVMFVGWEGVGLCSYLLIGFWFEKGDDGIGNARAAKKAFIVNRIGDFGLLIALFLIFMTFGSLNFTDVFSATGSAPQGVILAISLFMLLGVAGKSAQIPLYVWLPDAMAGPTPVSALIHAATMVTAGVYLMVRSQAFYTAAPLAAEVTQWMGALTALFAATIALGQTDIKKVLAYSTISQLGFMVAAVGLGAATAAMFHLITHSFFKALLFLTAGSVILGMEHSAEHQKKHHEGDPQDMRRMGGLWRRMPITFVVFLVGALALAGIPPLAGFFSKDEILAAASRGELTIFILLMISVFFTALYMAKQVFMIFGGKPRSTDASHASENTPLILAPLLTLAGLTLVAGELNLPGDSQLGEWLSYTLGHLEHGSFLLPVALLSIFLALVGIVLGWLLYGRKPQENAEDLDPLGHFLRWIFVGMKSKWWVDEIYSFLFIKPFQKISALLASFIDQTVIDGAANGLGTLTTGIGSLLRRLQNGFVRSYALMMLLGIVVILTFLVLR